MTVLTDTLRSQWLASLRGTLTGLRLVHQQTIARQHSSPTIAAGTAIARMLMAPPSAPFCAPGGRCGGGEGEGIVMATDVGAMFETACTVTPSAALSVAVGVAASDIAAALAAAGLGYVMVAWMLTEAA